MASACALAMFSGKNIYNFAILENLRIFQNCLFTGGVVEENGICSAAFCESAALRVSVLALSVKPCRACQLSQRERLWRDRILCTLAGNCTAMPRALPLGELAR